MVATIPYAFALALIGVSFIASEASGAALPLVAGLAAALGFTLQRLMRANSMATAALVTLYGLAYFVSAQGPLEEGFMDAFAAIRPDSVQRGLVGAMGFLMAVSLGAIVLAKTFIIRKLDQGLVAVMEFGGERALLQILGALGAFATFAAFASGAWTYYGSGIEDAPDQASTDVVRLEYMYQPAVFVALATCTWGLTRAVIHRRPWPQQLLLGSFTLVALLQAFMLQSRRVQVAAILCGAWALVPEFKVRTRKVRQRLVALAGMTAAAMTVGLLMWGSFLWRSTGTLDEVAVGERLTTVADSAVANEQSGVQAFDTSIKRFTYLWIDGLVQEYSTDLPASITVPEVWAINLIRAAPAFLVPQKRDVEPFSCETVIRIVSETDLPCTPTAETFTIGGWGSLALVAFSWSCIFALADRFIARRTVSGVLLGVSTAYSFMFIEVGLAPWVNSLRVVVVLLAAGLVAGGMRVAGFTQTRDKSPRPTA